MMMMMIFVGDEKVKRTKKQHSRHLPRVIEALVPPADEPSILVHAHDVIVIPIDDVLHGKLIAQLIAVGIAVGGVDAE
jgi:hypothetical protein